MNPIKLIHIDPMLHNAVRLKIMVALDSLESANFMYLCEITDAARGNVSIQLKTLQEAGYIEVSRSGSGPIAQTVCRITQLGMKALHEYEKELHKLFSKESSNEEESISVAG